MAELVDPNGNPIASDPAPQVDPRDTELAELREYQRQSQAFFERIEPQQERIKRLLDDPDTYGRLYDDSVKAYEAIREARKPQLGPEWNPENNPVLAEMLENSKAAKELKSKSDEFQAEQQKHANDLAVQEAYKYAEALAEKYPVLKEENYRIIQDWAKDAVKLGMSLQDYGARQEPLLKATLGKEPPKSLRSNAGASGVPGKSTPSGEEKLSLGQVFLARHKAKAG